MRTGHGRDSPLSPAETVSAPRLPRDSHTLARAPRLGVLNSVGRSFNVISGETEAQCVQGDLHKAGDNLQLTPVTPGSRTPVQSTTPRSPPKLFFGSIFSINHLTFSFFFFFLNKIQFIHTPWYFSGLSSSESLLFLPGGAESACVQYYYLNVYGLPFSAHRGPSSVESDGRTQVPSAPSALRLAAHGPLCGAAAEGPSGLRCSPR